MDHIIVSKDGRIRTTDRYVTSGSGKRIQKGQLLKVSNDKDGYLLVSISINKKRVTKRVHRLVAETYIDNPEGKYEVNHINGDKKDNRIENLEWVTRQENMKHAIDTGLIDTKDYPIKICPACNTDFQTHKNRLKYCSLKCLNIFQKNQSKKPEKEILYSLLVEHKSLDVVGSLFGEKRQTVNKWCKSYGIPHTTKYYKNLNN